MDKQIKFICQNCTQEFIMPPDVVKYTKIWKCSRCGGWAYEEGHNPEETTPYTDGIQR